MGHGHENILLSDHDLKINLDFLYFLLNRRTAIYAVFVPDFKQFLLNNRDQLLVAIQNSPQCGYFLLQFIQFFLQRRYFQIRQSVQLQGQNRIRLPLGKTEHPLQIVLRVLTVLGSLDGSDDLV
ncbi:hypothetical protein D3C77_541480 [compost metagenome]